jgi:hypothetical protein
MLRSIGLGRYGRTPQDRLVDYGRGVGGQGTTRHPAPPTSEVVLGMRHHYNTTKIPCEQIHRVRVTLGSGERDFIKHYIQQLFSHF